MATTPPSPVFSDINPQFANQSAQGELLFGNDDINNSISNILLIYAGERFRFPAFGSLIEDYIFQPQATAIETRLLRHILNLIAQWEKRVVTIPQACSVTRVSGRNAWNVLIVYTAVDSQISGQYQTILQTNGM